MSRPAVRHALLRQHLLCPLITTDAQGALAANPVLFVLQPGASPGEHALARWMQAPGGASA